MSADGDELGAVRLVPAAAAAALAADRVERLDAGAVANLPHLGVDALAERNDLTRTCAQDIVRQLSSA